MTSGDVLVVGVDGTDGGRRALRWALDQAAASNRRVRAVWVWQRDDLTTAIGVSPPNKPALNSDWPSNCVPWPDRT